MYNFQFNIARNLEKTIDSRTKSSFIFEIGVGPYKMSRVLVTRDLGFKKIKIYPRNFYKSWFTQAIEAFNANFNCKYPQVADKWHFVTIRPNTVITPPAEWATIKAGVVNITVFVSVFQRNNEHYLSFVAKEINIIKCKERHPICTDDTGDLTHNQDILNYIGYAVTIWQGEFVIFSVKDIIDLAIYEILPLKHYKKYKIDYLLDLEGYYHYALTFKGNLCNVKEFIARKKIPNLGCWAKGEEVFVHVRYPKEIEYISSLLRWWNNNKFNAFSVKYSKIDHIVELLRTPLRKWE